METVLALLEDINILSEPKIDIIVMYFTGLTRVGPLFSQPFFVACFTPQMINQQHFLAMVGGGGFCLVGVGGSSVGGVLGGGCGYSSNRRWGWGAGYFG